MDILVGKVTKQFRCVLWLWVMMACEDNIYFGHKYPNYCKICEEMPLSVWIFLFEIHKAEFIISRGLWTSSNIEEKWLRLSKYLPTEAVSSTILGQNDQFFWHLLDKSWSPLHKVGWTLPPSYCLHNLNNLEAEQFIHWHWAESGKNWSIS